MMQTLSHVFFLFCMLYFLSWLILSSATFLLTLHRREHDEPLASAFVKAMCNDLVRIDFFVDSSGVSLFLTPCF